MAIIDCKKKKFARAASFFAETLGLDDDVFVHVKVKKKMKGLFGYCEYLPEACDVLKTFLVVIEDGREEDPYEILAHEMVHVWQYARGDLVDGNAHSIWRGEPYIGIKSGSEDYYFSPWEVEAYGYSVGLMELYRRKYELH
jgi:hypothetical protein